MQNNDNNGFIFISHSFEDKQRVRDLRNIFENRKFDALCFFLKCLTDKHELNDLIKREINAREWFICAKSENALKSNWVHQECLHRLESKGVNIEGLKTAPLEDLLEFDDIIVVDLDSHDSMYEAVMHLTNELSVNIINSIPDEDFALKLANGLRERDLQVTATPAESPLECAYNSPETRGCDEINETGANIVILSKNSIDSKFLKNELRSAFVSDSKLIPVYIDDIEPKGKYKFLLDSIQDAHAPIKDDRDLNEFIDYVCEEIKKSLNKRVN